MDDSAVPAAALEALRQTEISLADLSGNLAQFLSVVDADALAEMPPLHRARAFIVLARTASELLSVRLRCSGIRPDDHPIKTELERLSLHEAKLDRFIGRSKEPLRPSTTINYQAATRVIRHSLPDLTPEQRQDLRKISGQVGVRGRFAEDDGSRKRRKHQDTEKQSVRAAAQDFLEKASRELLGSNEWGMKGPYPLREESSESSDEVDAMRS